MRDSPGLPYYIDCTAYCYNVKSGIINLDINVSYNLIILQDLEVYIYSTNISCIKVYFSFHIPGYVPMELTM